jgi:predicted nuclease of predicted toxin-antitoxin system
MRFIVDAQLPPALARWLTDHGHEAEHVFDFGGDGTTDSEIWRRALMKTAAIITKDEDFSMRSMREADAPQVVWIRVGNTRRTTLLAWIEKVLPDAIKALARGERIVEIA